ncbi:MAG TPA: MAC/perforin domain-containing protein [Saprospiraceae bacterium]|nr:MAC/perforin domain-containing protein [Saprospiraceae bacterium]
MKYPSASTASNFPLSSPLSLNRASLDLKKIKCISFWVAPKWSNATSDGCVYSFNQGSISLSISKDLDKIKIAYYQQQFECTFDWTHQNFHHITFFPLSGRLKINDLQIDETYALDQNNKHAFLGDSVLQFDLGHNNGSELFTGIIQGFRLWASELSDAAIFFSGDLSSDQKNQIPFYPFLKLQANQKELFSKNLIAYQLDAASGGVAFEWHHEITGIYIYSDDKAIDKLSVKPIDAQNPKGLGRIKYVPFIGISNDPKDQAFVLSMDENIHLFRFACNALNEYTCESQPHFKIKTSLDTSGGEEILKLALSGVPQGLKIKSGEYVHASQDEDDLSKDADQHLSNVFVTKASGLEFLKSGWKVGSASFNPLFPSENDLADTPIFQLPPGSSYQYRSGGPGGNQGMPFGYFYESIDIQTGGLQSIFINSVEEFSSKIIEGKGFNLGAKLNYMAKIGVNYEKSTTMTDMEDTVTSEESSVSFTHYLNMSYLLALEKRNLILSDAFLTDLSDLIRHQNSTKFTHFFKIYGTHYALAATFGGRGYNKTVLHNESIKEMILHGVDIKSALNANAGTDKAGSLSGGINQQNQAEYSHIFSKKSENSSSGFKTYGEISAFGNIPASPHSHFPHPISFELRPISDLLGPPFFNEYPIISGFREKLHQEILKIVPEKVSIPHSSARYVSVSFANYYLKDNPGFASTILPPKDFADQLKWDLYTKTKTKINPVFKGLTLPDMLKKNLLIFIPADGDLILKCDTSFVPSSTNNRVYTITPHQYDETTVDELAFDTKTNAEHHLSIDQGGKHVDTIYHGIVRSQKVSGTKSLLFGTVAKTHYQNPTQNWKNYGQEFNVNIATLSYDEIFEGKVKKNGLTES